MHIEKISETSGVNSWHEYFVEDRLIDVLVVGNFCRPVSPFVFFYVPEVVVAQSTLREFNLDQRSEDSVEFIQEFVIILTTSNTATVSPHSGIDEKGFVNDFLFFFFFLGSIDTNNILVLLGEEAVKDHTNTLDESHCCRRSQVKNFGLVVHVRGSFDVALETSKENSLSNLVYGRVLNLEGVFSSFHVGLRSFKPTVHEGIPSNIDLVDEQHSTSRYCCWRSIFKVRDLKEQSH
jgi:DNA-directed RNA polymerase subunit N (RpoN/RPB10)